MKRLFPGLVLLAALPATVRGQAPAGAEFRVNTYTTDLQSYSAVASDASGNFVVVWYGYRAGNLFDVFAQRLNAAGVRQGSEFRVNTYTTAFQGPVAVASNAGGNFMVVWASYDPDGSGFGIFAQRYNASGIPQGSEFQVNSYTSAYQYAPAVASDAGGNFIVVWHSKDQDGSDYGVFGQRLSATGVRQGAEFRVNTYTTGRQLRPAVASDPAGSFVVVWSSDGQDGSLYGIFGRRFDASGAPQGSEFRVNTYTTSIQRSPRVAADENGNFVVVWQSSGPDGGDYGIFGQRFTASGIPQGSEFQVNAYTTGFQTRPAVTSKGNGDFVVAWEDFYQGAVFGRRFDASGVAQGSEFRVGSGGTFRQTTAALAADPDGDFIAVWTSEAQDGSGKGIFGQRYGDLIFEDGFESGDLGRWSAVATDGADLFAFGGAAMAGTKTGLLAFVDDTNPLYVQDDTPDSENRYRARFYFDPNGFDPGEAQSHFRTRIFIAFDDAGLRLITLVLKRQGGAFSIEGRVRLDDGTRADTGFFPIADAPHFFELDWIRSSAPVASDGSFTLRIDNTPVSVLTLLNNDASPVGFVRLGALGIKTGAAGTLFYDQFESRRQVFIGPE